MSERRAEARRLEGEGQLEDALASYQACGAVGDAARVAWRLGRYREGVELAKKAGLHFLAALCLIKINDEKRALYHLVRVAPDDKNYRAAAVRAVALAHRSKQLDMRFDNFIHRFTVTPTQNKSELRALIALGELYGQQGFVTAAKQALTTALQAEPTNQAALNAMDALQSGRTLAHRAPASAQSKELSAEMAYRRAGRRALQELAKASTPTPELAAAGAKRRQRFWVPALDIGSVINDRYEIKSLLGKGGMASVFEVEDLELSGRLALKIFSKLMTTEEEEERFRREASLSRRLTHDNIIRVWDVGKVHGYKFITMALLRGRDLAEELLERGRLELLRSLKILRQAASGLAYAHSRRVVHRDIKPSNFFLDSKDHVKIMDFGIAKEHGAKKLTSTGVILGTPEYISPEQIHDFTGAGHSTDLYGLGVTAYRMLTGQLPFDSPQHVEILLKHLNEPPTPLREIEPSIPASVEAVVLKLLRKDPAERQQSSSELEADLDRLIAEQGG